MDTFILSDKMLEKAHRRVFTVEVDGQRYYVKKRMAVQSRYGPLLQRAAYAATGNMLLAPTTFADPQAALAYEEQKLKTLRRADVPVPEVVHNDPRYIVLEDVGSVAHKAVKKNPHKAATHIAAATRALARLHNAGFAHGGAQLKNFTLKNNKTYLIDFEEQVERYPLEDMQFRDIFVFLAYLGRLDVEIDYATVIARYEDIRGMAVADKLARSVNRLRWMKMFNTTVFDRFPLQDVKAFARLVAHLEALEPQQ